MPFTLPDLPYPKDSLQPYISAETLEYHHGKHHQKYVTKLNSLIAESEWATKELEEIIRGSEGGVFNNAAQVFNHTFYWSCLRPNGGGEPSGAVADALTSSFGSVDAFKDEFTKAALNRFGSGWAWLVYGTGGDLEIESTLNAGTPIRDGKKPVLTCDVWEHAYYIDYRNSRPDYLDAFWKVVNWDFVAQNL